MYGFGGSTPLFGGPLSCQGRKGQGEWPACAAKAAFGACAALRVCVAPARGRFGPCPLPGATGGPALTAPAWWGHHKKEVFTMPSTNIPNTVRKAIYRRDGFRCALCDSPKGYKSTTQSGVHRAAQISPRTSSPSAGSATLWPTAPGCPNTRSTSTRSGWSRPWSSTCPTTTPEAGIPSAMVDPFGGPIWPGRACPVFRTHTTCCVPDHTKYSI